MRAVLVSSGKVEKYAKTAATKEMLGTQKGFIWLDGSPHEDEVKHFIHEFNLPLDIVGQYGKERKVKHRVEEKYAILTLQELSYEDGLKASPILMVLGSKFIISIHEHSVACEQVYRDVERLASVYKVNNPSFILYMVALNLSELSFKIVEGVEPKVWEIEKEITETHTADVVKKVVDVRRTLMHLNKVNFSFAEVLFSAKKGVIPYVNDSKIFQLVDEVYESLTRQIETVNDYRELLAESLQIYNAKTAIQLTEVNKKLSVASHRLNFELKDLTLVMLFLTVVSTIYMFPNTVATILGIPVFTGKFSVSEVLAVIAVSMVIPTLWIIKQSWVRRLLKSGFEIPVVPFLPFLSLHDRSRKRKI